MSQLRDAASRWAEAANPDVAASAEDAGNGSAKSDATDSQAMRCLIYCSSRILRSPSCGSHAWAIESGSPGIHRCRVGGFALALMLPEPRDRPLEPFVKVGGRGTGEQRAEPIALGL